MKYLVLFAVIAVVLWLLRAGRPSHNATTPADKAKTKSLEPQTMATCPACGIHFPATDGTQGRLALYCSDSHRAAAEA